MAKAVSHRRAKMTIPLAVAAGFIPVLAAGATGYNGGSVHMDVAAQPGFMGMVKQMGFRLSGFSPDTHKFYPSELAKGVGPIVLGIMVHKFAGQMGVNRAIARAGIPLLRI